MLADGEEVSQGQLTDFRREGDKRNANIARFGSKCGGCLSSIKIVAAFDTYTGYVHVANRRIVAGSEGSHKLMNIVCGCKECRERASLDNMLHAVTRNEIFEV
jgi:hypothetical protein